MTDFITEPERHIPVSHDVDVVVAGGGTAGIAAAVCAARLGLSVVMVENSATPGGMVTQVTTWLSDFDNKGGFAREFLDEINRRGICRWPYYNPFEVVPYFDSLIADAGVRPLYLSAAVAPLMVEAGRLGGVIVESKSGRHAVRAKVVIDATGDGDIAARAGADFQFGRPSDGAWQSITLFHLITNYTGGHIKRDEFAQLAQDAGEKAGVAKLLPYDRADVRTLPATEHSYWSGLSHVTDLSPLDAEQLSDAIVALRKQADTIFHALRDHVPQFAGIEYGHLSPIPGIRESRRIVCDTNITLEDVRAGTRHKDGLFTVTQAIDIHKCHEDEPAIYVEKVQPYHVPYRALLPTGLEGIILAGRCIGGDHEAEASYRIIADCYAMGEAAAIAARMAVDADCGPRGIPVSDLVAEMSARGYQQ